jgi:DNA-binding XRE family transcriptional regulator
MAEATYRPDGRKIRELMQKRRWTQEKLAKKAGVSVRTISSMERAADDPSVRCTEDSIKEVARAFRMMGKMKDGWLRLVLPDAGSDQWAVDPRTGKGLAARQAATFTRAGIITATDGFDLNSFTDLVERNPEGDIIVINTWIESFETIRPVLKRALQKDVRRRVAVYRLAEGSKAAGRRAEELPGDNVTASFGHTNARIASFLARDLTPEQRGRVAVYDMEEMPRFSIHAAGESCLVGFYWLATTATKGPHLRIDGRDGPFARFVWEYIEQVRAANREGTRHG